MGKEVGLEVVVRILTNDHRSRKLCHGYNQDLQRHFRQSYDCQLPKEMVKDEFTNAESGIIRVENFASKKNKGLQR